MTSVYKRYLQCFEELNDVDKSGCQIIYSQITKRQFEEYCNKNLLCCKDSVMSDYKKSVVCQIVFRIVCFVTLFIIGTRLLEYCGHVYGWMNNNCVLTGLLIAICLGVSEIIAFKIKNILFPLNAEIERQLKYQQYVEENCYPLLELQEVMKKNTVSSIHIKTLNSLIEVSFYDKAGKIRSRSVYFDGENIEYEKDGVLDFTGIDDAIIRRAGELGLNHSCRII